MTNHFQLMVCSKQKSFTLIELLVVLALVATLSVVVVLTLNPAELIKQARDSNRLSDLATINTALNLFSTDVTSGFMGTSTVVYVSIPSASPTCVGLGLPTLPTGYSYNCVTSQNLRNTDGTGWIPVNFQRISSNSPISQLPIDPINTTTTGSYYAYITGGSWMLSAVPESQKQKLELSNSPHLPKFSGVIALGNNLDLSPLYNSGGLVGYWKFDDGGTVVAKDSSGLGNDGVWYGTTVGTQRYVSGKVGAYSGYFNGVSDYLNVGNPSSLNINSNQMAMAAWIKPTVFVSDMIIINKESVYEFGIRNGIFQAAIETDSANNWAWAGSKTVQLNSYSHVAFSYGNSMWNFYINGVKVELIAPGNSQIGNILTTSTDFKISNRSSFSHYFKGEMDEIRVYNRALSDAEVTALYNSTR